MCAFGCANACENQRKQAQFEGCALMNTNITNIPHVGHVLALSPSLFPRNSSRVRSRLWGAVFVGWRSSIHQLARLCSEQRHAVCSGLLAGLLAGHCAVLARCCPARPLGGYHREPSLTCVCTSCPHTFGHTVKRSKYAIWVADSCGTLFPEEKSLVHTDNKDDNRSQNSR